MRKFVIISLYFLVFWVLIPVLLIGISNRLEVYLNYRQSPSIFAGCIVLFFSVPLLVISFLQYFKYSGELPVSSFPPKNIIRRGLYNYWRHPIYLFYVITFIGIALILGSFAMLLIVLPVFILLIAIYTLMEELRLTERFGDAYNYYTKRTGILIPTFYQSMRYPLLMLLKYLFHYQVKNKKLIPVSPPYFIVAEHKNYLDPIFIGLSIPHPVSYLTTFEMYRSQFNKWLMRLLWNIPRKRFKQDYSSNKIMFESIEKGAVIGIFPEGERSWTGETQQFKPEVLKLLLKKNDIPILPIKINGNYPAWPRWAKGFIRYKISVEIREPFFPDPADTAEVLEKKIKNRLGNSNTQEKITKKSFDFGKGLEKVFYRCSECGAFNSFTVDKGIITCGKCGLTLQISSDLKVTYKKNESTIRLSIAEYYRNIKVKSDDLLFKKEMAANQVHYHEIAVDLQESGKCQLFVENGKNFDLVLNGNLILNDNSMICKNDQNICFLQYQDISSVTTEGNDKLQIYNQADGQLYQLKFKKGSVLQWQDIITSAILLKMGRLVNKR